MRVTLNALENLPKSVLVEYDNAGQMLADVKSLRSWALSVQRMNGYDASFYGGVPSHALDTLVQQGDKGVADRSRSLLAKINAETPPRIERVRKPRPFGRAVTGAYLAGDPMPCRARVKVPSHHAPLTIVANVSSSAAAKASDLEKRGIAIAALVQKVAGLRPVRLVLTGVAHTVGTDPVAWTCDFPTRPVDAYRLAWLLSSQGFARGMGFAVYRGADQLYARAGGKARDGSYSQGIRWAGGQAYENGIGPRSFGADLGKHFRGEVFYIGAAGTEGNSYAMMLTDPVKWINSVVTKLQA